jgi:uncharacterized RDD family membrane protein YckC
MTAGVVTGEAVALDVRLAHWPSRLLAKVLDVIAQFILFFVLVLIVGRLASDADADADAAIVLCVVVVVFVGYNVLLETVWRGRTLGKAALGLRVVRDDGGPVRFRHALVRGIMFPLEGWGPALVASIFSKRGKRFGDMLAGTIVVQERVPGVTAMPVQMPAPLAWWAATLDLSRFDDGLALACRQFLARQNELNPGSRDAMGGELVAAVLARVTPPPPPGTPGWAYLSAVLAERRRREEQRMYAAVPVVAPQYGAVPQYGGAGAVGGAPQYGSAPQGFGPSYGAPQYGGASQSQPFHPQPPAPSYAPPPVESAPMQPAEPPPPGPFAPPQ